MFLLSTPSQTLTSDPQDLSPCHQIAMTPPQSQQSPAQPLHGSFLGGSPYCFSYLFYKGVHWLRFISKERQPLHPRGIPHPKRSHNPPCNMVFLPHPSIEGPKKPPAEVASPIPRRHGSFLEPEVVVQATPQVLGRFPAPWDQACRPATRVSHSEWEGEAICGTVAED